MNASMSNVGGAEMDLDSEEQEMDEGVDMKSRATLCLATVYVFICVIGFTANAAVLLMIARSRRSKAVTNIFIFNLAVADLLYAVCLPAAIYQMLNGQWTIGHMTCKLYYTCDGVSKFASVMFLVILSFDRYMAVCHPIRCRSVRTAKLAFITTGLAWAIVILAMVPVFLHATLLEVTVSGSDSFQCVIYWPPSPQSTGNDTAGHEDHSYDPQLLLTNVSDLHGVHLWNRTDYGIGQTLEILSESFNGSLEDNGAGPPTNWSRRIFTIYLFTLSFLAPLAMVWIFYTMILLKLREQKRRLFSAHAANSVTERPSPTATTAADDGPYGDEDDRQNPSLRQKRPMLPSHMPAPVGNAANQRRSRSTKRVTIMVLSIVICYTVCWIPYWFVQLTVEFFPDAVQPVFGYEVFTIISYIAYGMQSVNSMLNPFLYAFGTQTHRRRLCSRYREFLSFGCRWRFFGVGSPPPGGPHVSLLRHHDTDRNRLTIAEEVSVMDSCVLRRQESPVGQNGDRLHPRHASRARGPDRTSVSYCESDISHSGMAGGGSTTRKDDHRTQAPFAYCLCCYCQPYDAPVDKTKKPPAKKIISAQGAAPSGKQITVPKVCHDDDEDD